MAGYAEIDIGALRRYRRRPGMGNILARQPMALWAQAYGTVEISPSNTLIDAAGQVRVPTPAFFIERQKGVIDRLAAHLVPGGALYLSFKLGTGERFKDGRRFTDMTVERLAALLDGCGAFGQPDIWQSRDCRPDRASEVWVNSLAKKT